MFTFQSGSSQYKGKISIIQYNEIGEIVLDPIIIQTWTTHVQNAILEL